MINGRKIVAICVSDMQNADTVETLYQLYEDLERENWKTILFNTGTELRSETAFDMGEEAVFDLIPFDKVDGIIIFWRTIKNPDLIQQICAKAMEAGKPVVLLDCDEPREGAYNVVYDERGAFRDLMIHLVEEHSFVNINCIAGIKDNYVSERRLAIFREVLASHNIPLRDDQIGYGNFYDIPAVAVLQQFLNSPYGMPEAIVCLNDAMAIAVTDFLSDHGLRVPEDVTVTGLDGIVQERCNYPRITTCRRNVPALSHYVLGLLFDAVAGRNQPGVFDYVLYFDPAESCGCRKEDPTERMRAVSALNRLTSENMNTDREMVNMMTRLTGESTPEGMHRVLRRSVSQNSYFCINEDHDTPRSGTHRHGDKPFTDVVISYRYFHGERETEKRLITPQNLIPEWGIFERRSYPMVVNCLHAQDRVCGYLVSYPEAGAQRNFEYALQKIQHLCLNLDIVLGLYIQQRRLQNINAKLRLIQDGIVEGFSELVESRDDSTGMHIKRTREYMRLLVDYMAEKPRYAELLTKEKRDLIVKAAPLHDIGKIKVSDVILNKPGRLTAEEFETMKIHTTEGRRLIETTLNDIEDGEYLNHAMDVAMYHHEKWNGSGYPKGLSGEEIPLCARLMAVVDVFDALSSKRVYKDAFSLDDTFRIIEESSGTHFDPEIAECFLQLRPEIEEAFYELHREEERLNAIQREQ
ncbi:MAG: substrate-binding domain-containing protein [Lachnospiraceae bacterium]|nr:substrate-binding domain-containing protein [Lachnospiraceae bacterium]